MRIYLNTQKLQTFYEYLLKHNIIIGNRIFIFKRFKNNRCQNINNIMQIVTNN